MYPFFGRGVGGGGGLGDKFVREEKKNRGFLLLY
jgi:hypothetical protein